MKSLSEKTEVSPESSPSATILICDDQAINLELLVQGLKNNNYHLLVANNGEQALDIARRLPVPDLVLLDIVMPGIDGYEVCRQLKADPVTAAIPIIFITGLNQHENELQGLNLGAADYIFKPFNLEILNLRVQHHLTLKKQRDLLEKQNRELEKALSQVKLLSGMLPICASCKKIRDDKGYWETLESYLEDHAEVEFTHGICPDCIKKLYPEFDGKE